MPTPKTGPAVSREPPDPTRLRIPASRSLASRVILPLLLPFSAAVNARDAVVAVVDRYGTLSKSTNEARRQLGQLQRYLGHGRGPVHSGRPRRRSNRVVRNERQSDPADDVE